MGKTEIIRELGRLSPEELAEVRARLDELAAVGSRGTGSLTSTKPPTVHLRTPRLANPAQLRDFTKQVTELRHQ